VTEYIYDGKRVIQERDGNNGPTVSYTRGSDLSSTFEGAGGIGGMLARSSGYSGGNWSTHYYYFADGNGNITYMLDGSQNSAATYRYDPFGNITSQSGVIASANVYRFSSKEIHVNSGMYYYLNRFYDPNLQRWINRDPIEEAGGVNLYGFVLNRPLSYVDLLGLNSLNGLGPNGQSLWYGPYDKTPPGSQFVLWDGNAQFTPYPGWTWGRDHNGNAIPIPNDLMGLQPSGLGDFLLGGLGNAARGSVPACVVSRWGSDLRPGSWVQRGRPNLWNYFRSGKWQPGLGNEFAPPWAGKSYIVSPASLKSPTGFGVDGFIKSMFGQARYEP
jgi:RHS repeat-associated protein